MKKFTALLLSLVMVLACAVSASAEDTIRIGVFEPSSGDNGAGGKQEVIGIEYANSLRPTVDVNGTTYKVELVIVDNQSATDKAVTAAQSLVSSGVSIVLGSYGSGVSIAGSQYFADAGIPAIGVTCTNPAVTEGNTHYFRICFLDPFQGTVLANFAADNFQAKTAYTLSKQGDDYSGGLCYYFKEAFEALGGTVISDTFPTGNSDFTSYLSNATAIGAEVFFCPVSIAYSTQIVALAKSMNLEIPILGSDTLDNNTVLEAAQDSSVDLRVSTFYADGANPEFDAGFKEFINSSSENLTNNGGNDNIAAVSVMGYDAYYVALEAIKAAGSIDSTAIQAALWDVQYDGVTGSIAFDDVNGDAVRDTAFIKIADTANNVWTSGGSQQVAG